MYIRQAREEDMSQIADLYGHYVQNTVEAIDLISPPVEEWIGRLHEADRDRKPFMVAVLKKTKHDGFMEFLHDFEKSKKK